MNAPTSPFLSPRPLRLALPAVLLLSTLFFANYTNRAVIGPLLGDMEASLGLNHVQSTSFLFCLSVGFSIGMLFSGIGVALIRPKLVAALSAMLCGLMTALLSQLESAEMIRIVIAGAGFFGGFYLTAALAILADLVRAEDISKGIAIHELAPALSFIVTPLLAGIGVRYLAWQGTIAVTGCISFCTGLAFLVFGKGGTQKLERPSVSGVKEGFKQPVLWLFVWLFALSVGGEMAPFSVLTLSLTQEHGIASPTAALMISFSRVLTPVAVIGGGWACTILGIKRTLSLFLLLQGLGLLLMALPFSVGGYPLTSAAMTCQAASTGIAFPPLFTLFSRSFPSRQQAMLLSLSLPLGIYIGTGVIPFLLGASGQHLSFAFGYGLFGCVSLASLLLLRPLNTVR